MEAQRSYLQVQQTWCPFPLQTALLLLLLLDHTVPATSQVFTHLRVFALALPLTEVVLL